MRINFSEKVTIFFGTSLIAFSLHAQATQSVTDGANAIFVQKAAQGGMAEVDLSTLAVTTANSAEVENFAQTMVRDHSANNRQLAAIATSEHIPVPGAIDTEHMQLYEQLAALHGADFDRVYVAAMRSDHQKMIDLLTTSETSVSSDELITFIKKTLPVVRAHLQMANDLKTQ